MVVESAGSSCSHFSFNRIKCDEINQKLELFNQQENHKSICTDYKKFWCYGDGCGGTMERVYSVSVRYSIVFIAESQFFVRYLYLLLSLTMSIFIL